MFREKRPRRATGGAFSVKGAYRRKPAGDLVLRYNRNPLTRYCSKGDKMDKDLDGNDSEKITDLLYPNVLGSYIEDAITEAWAKFEEETVGE